MKNGSKARLEVLLQAAFLEWALSVTHERALELAETKKIHWFFRALALNAIAYFAHGRKDDETPLVILEDEESFRRRAARLEHALREVTP